MLTSSRNLLLSSLFLALLFAAPATSIGQTKIAYLDASKLLKKMPEANDATSRLDQLIASWGHEADDIQGEINRKQTDYDHRKLILTDAERNAMEVDLQNLHKRLEDYRQQKYGANGELFTQQAQLMKPAYDRLMKAIDEAAHEGGFDYVLDRSSKDIVMLYSNSKYDLTVPVARKLNIESDILSQPLISTNPAGPGGKNPGGIPGANNQGTTQGMNQGTNTSIPGNQINPGGANQGMNPNPGINTVNSNPNQPGSFNSGSYNPDQTPTPPQKAPATPGH